MDLRGHPVVLLDVLEHVEGDQQVEARIRHRKVAGVGLDGLQTPLPGDLHPAGFNSVASVCQPCSTSTWLLPPPAAPISIARPGGPRRRSRTSSRAMISDASRTTGGPVRPR